MTDERRQREKAGRRAEHLAAWLLRLKGYRLLATRAKAPVGEVDLIAARGKSLVAVEVKNRQTLPDALAALERHRWQRTQRALDWWAAGHPAWLDHERRFDAIAVAGLRLKHIPDAWRPCF